LLKLKLYADLVLNVPLDFFLEENEFSTITEALTLFLGEIETKLLLCSFGGDC
tara:strand:+ start:548 stop:706 length:159 start_codon:yes stop_codon:yes gene_type:complete